jgi:CRISPR/Cas system CSM-associated protein Csm3 (group 7 of RAMP superfamily)
MTNKDMIIERVYIKGDYVFTSPAYLGSGQMDRTDNDLIKDSEGNPVILGTSIAGVLRNYLAHGALENLEDTYVQLLFGERGIDNESTQSKIYINDAKMKKFSAISVRNGVRLELLNKVAEDKSKYDYEVLHPGATFTFTFEVVLRKNDPRLEIKKLLFQMLNALMNGEIRFGAKTNRGYGKGKLRKDSLTILSLEFPLKEADADAWINFDWDTFKKNTNIQDWVSEYGETTNEANQVKISVPLSLKHSLMIRSNPYDPTDSDYRQLSVDGKPVIPGSSWAGAIRHHMFRLLMQLTKQNEAKINPFLDDLFGFVDKQDRTAKASRIIVEESTLHGSTFITQRRVKIDRFTGGAVHSALYDSDPCFGGNTELTIQIKNPKDAEVGLLLLVLKDLQEGFLAVGGETGVGRGIFQGEEIEINAKQLDSQKQKEYLDALFVEIQKFREEVNA